MNLKYENKELCSKCGGICCKKGGCLYSPNDFTNLKIDYLIDKLSNGYISISSYQDFHLINKKLLCNPMLYLRTRNINRPIIDLISLPSKCSALRDNGCLYDIDNRPSGGVNLIPMANNGCYPDKNPFEFVLMWQPYQDILRKIVKRFTGKSIDENIRKDVYNLFLEIYIKKNENQILDSYQRILNELPSYISAFPDEHYNALISYCAKYINNPIRTRKK